MRTTLTLDPDIAARLKAIMRERGLSFKQVVNDTLRAGLGQPAQGKAFVVEAREMGLRAGVDLTKALRLATDMEDEARVRDLEQRK